MGTPVENLADKYVEEMRKVYDILVSASEVADALYSDAKRALLSGVKLSRKEASRIFGVERKVFSLISLIQSTIDQSRQIVYMMEEEKPAGEEGDEDGD